MDGARGLQRGQTEIKRELEDPKKIASGLESLAKWELCRAMMLPGFRPTP